MAVIAKNKVLLIIVGVLLLTNIVMLVIFLGMKRPQFPDRGRGGREWSGAGGLLAKKVGFTPQQLDAYEQLKKAHWEKMKPLLTDMRNAKDSFYRLLYKPAVTDSVLYRVADSIGRRQMAIDLQTFRHFQEVRRLCEPEQRPQFDSLIHNVIYRMSGRMRIRRDKPADRAPAQ